MGFRIQGVGCRVKGEGSRVQGAVFRVQCFRGRQPAFQRQTSFIFSYWLPSPFSQYLIRALMVRSHGDRKWLFEKFVS